MFCLSLSMKYAVKKLSFKYQFLKLELDDIVDSAEDYLTEFNKQFGKYFIDKNSEVWINEETGEVRDKPPAEIKSNKRAKDPKLKKLYKKLSQEYSGLKDKADAAQNYIAKINEIKDFLNKKSDLSEVKEKITVKTQHKNAP